MFFDDVIKIKKLISFDLFGYLDSFFGKLKVLRREIF